MLIKTEEVQETGMANSFLDSCTEDVGLRAPYGSQVEGHLLGLQDDIQPSSCFSNALPREVAFDTSSLTRLVANPELYSQEQPEAGLNYQSTLLDESASATSFQPQSLRSNTPSPLKLTRASSRLKNLRMGDHGLNTQEGCEEEEQQRDYRELSAASTVTRRFSGLSLSSVSSPLVQALPAPITTSTATTAVTASSPAASTSFSAASAIYFPPTASALHQKRRKALKQELRVPRPKNCFMLYRSKVLPMIMAEFGNINNKIISKIAAERWRAESEHVKTWYRDMAKYGKEEHARNNPGYKYAPLNKMRTMAATALSHLVQSQHSSKTVNSSHDSDEVDMSEDNKAGDEDYIDGSSRCRRQSARQCQRHQQPITRFGFRSQAGKRRNSNLGLENSLSPQNKKLRDHLENHVSYPPLNFSTDSYSSLVSAETIGFPMFGQQQLQYQGCYQAYPLADPHRSLPTFPYDASTSAATASTTTSIYGLAGDKNTSEVTLVDPIDHWTTHRYHDAPSSLDLTNLSPMSTTLLSPNSGIQKSKLAATSLMSPSKLRMIDPKILMEKELPPLPHEIAAYNSNINDPNSVLAQMFLDYNPHSQQHAQQPPHHHRQHYQHHQHQLSTSSSSSTTTTFRTTELYFSAMKEPKMSTVGNTNIGAVHHVQQQHTHEQNPFQHAFQQHTQQQQPAFQKHTLHQHQQQFQQYLQQ
ncbi:hypothetical protein BGZ96_004216 [Linnemannia gamsii]|uniref:HMG box domain-containing protein n=1 Tax=Linnemannia gamsii TaxID=64522 RepID=A0ABQ7KHD0_9FUNG|nr:hypothetical protein BGZ96_004216 [Linnemannia gamsii]